MPIRPLRARAYCGESLNLLAATSRVHSSLQSSYDTIWTPFNQCSTWLPLTRILDVFQEPAGRVASRPGGCKS